jgi:hypothetical protein
MSVSPPAPGELSIAVSSGPFAAPVLSRTIRVLAARGSSRWRASRSAAGHRHRRGHAKPDRRQQDPARHRSSPGSSWFVSVPSGRRKHAAHRASAVGSRRCWSGSPSSAGLSSADGELLCLILGAR